MINVTFFGHVLRQQLRAKGEFGHVKKRAGIVLVFITTESFHGLRGYSCIIDVMIRRHLTWLQSPGATIIAELVAFAP